MTWPGFRFGIKHCCGCAAAPVGCQIFERTRFDDLSGLTIQSGTVTTENGKLIVTGPARILIDEMPQAIQDPIRVYVKARRTAGDPAKLRPFGGYKDVSNYYFGEWDYNVAGNSATIRQHKKFNGSESALSDAVTVHDDTELSQEHDLYYCLQPPQQQESEPRIKWGLPYSVTGGGLWGGHDGAKLPFVIDSATADASIAAGSTTADLTALFSLGIPLGSTPTGIDYGVVCSATQAGTTTITSILLALPSGSHSSAAGEAVGSTLAGHGAGGAGNLLGLNPTAQDFNSAAIVVAFTRSAGGPPDVVSVDYFTLNVYYNTPDKTPGKSTLTFTNLETGADPQIHCVDASFEEMPEGKQAGVEFPYGDWEVSALKLEYHYSVSKPLCPRCTCGTEGGGGGGDGGGTASCRCCAASPPEFMAHRVYLANLGGGGWTNNLCLGCDTILGEYLQTLSGGPNRCEWVYRGPPRECGLLNSVARLGISLILQPINADATACVWELDVLYFVTSTTGPSVVGWSWAKYLASRTPGDTNCGDDTPITLTKVREEHHSENPFAYPSPCLGSLPNTITINLG